ncbi:MAG: Ig-like domain-containing protein [Pyrinomonadaceae bacterium]
MISRIPARLELRGLVSFTRLGDYAGTAIAVDAKHVYMTGELGVANDDNVPTGNTRLFIGEYQPEANASPDNTAPDIALTAPSEGVQITEGSRVTLTAEATDDTRVAAVQFSINGQPMVTDTTFPYQATVSIPAGATTIVIGAAATDVAGNRGASTLVTFQVSADTGPTITITSPAEGQLWTRGRRETLTATATDNGNIASVAFTVNGQPLSPITAAPYTRSYTVPANTASATIMAVATDNLGATSSVTRTVNVLSDPGTTVTGRVVDSDNQPVAGATARTTSPTAVQTGNDGRFTILGVPTINGNITADASATINNQNLRGSSAAVVSIPGGQTDVGDIVLLSPGVFWDSWVKTNGPEGGYVKAFASTGAGIFAATFNGVYKSVDGGASWTPTSNGLAFTRVYSLIADGTILYVGTRGGGVYKSDDGGVLWTQISAGLPLSLTVHALVANTGVLFAGTDGGGIYRSINNGQTWAKSDAGLSNANVRALAVDGNVIYAGTFDGVFRSDDQGLNWTASSNGIVGLSVNSLLVKDAYIFAGTPTNGDDGGVYRTADGGASWTQMVSGMTEFGTASLATNGTALYSGGSSIFRSIDNGESWTRLDVNLMNRAADSLFANGTGTVLFGTGGGGVFRSVDEGVTWAQANAGLSIPIVYSVIPVGDTFYAGTFGNGVFKTTDFGATWIPASQGLTTPFVLALTAKGQTSTRASTVAASAAQQMAAKAGRR